MHGFKSVLHSSCVKYISCCSANDELEVSFYSNIAKSQLYTLKRISREQIDLSRSVCSNADKHFT